MEPSKRKASKADMVKAVLGVLVTADVMAVIENGDLQKSYSIYIVPDFENAVLPERRLRYDVASDIDKVKVNTKPLPLAVAEQMLEILNAAKDVAEGNRAEALPVLEGITISDADEGFCYVVYVSTGCTCCRDENFYVGPFLEEGQARASAKYHKDCRTLRSQYAENGHQTIYKVPYEVRGEYVILDKWYAVPTGFEDDSAVYGTTLDNFKCYSEIVK